jgi:hypothetical protein
MAAPAENKKKEVNAMSEMKNWEQRVLTEMEAPHKWNEAWGDFFAKGIPIEYGEKIKYLEGEMKR